jgi:hypothetical protein
MIFFSKVNIVTLGKNTSVFTTLGLFVISFSIILVGGLPTVNCSDDDHR